MKRCLFLKYATNSSLSFLPAQLLLFMVFKLLYINLIPHNIEYYCQCFLITKKFLALQLSVLVYKWIEFTVILLRPNFVYLFSHSFVSFDKLRS